MIDPIQGIKALSSQKKGGKMIVKVINNVKIHEIGDSLVFWINGFKSIYSLKTKKLLNFYPSYQMDNDINFIESLNTIPSEIRDYIVSYTGV